MSEHLIATTPPDTDPTPIFEHFRGSYGTELLTAAIAHFNVVGLLAESSMSIDELQAALDIEERPAVVLTTALRAMGLIDQDASGKLALTPMATEHLVPGRCV